MIPRHETKNEAKTEPKATESSDETTAQDQAARMTVQVRLCQRILRDARDSALAKGIPTIPHLIALCAEYAVIREKAVEESGETCVRDLENRLRDLASVGVPRPRSSGAPCSMYV